MDPQAALQRREQAEELKLKQLLGEQTAIQLIQQHHHLVRENLSHFPEGEEIERVGDSFFIVFAKPSDAVKFSLQLQAKLRAVEPVKGQRTIDRVGIHV